MPPKEQTPNQNPTSSAPSAANPMKRNGGGVADYFAILGIGETLELKSTQKKYQRVSTTAGDENERLEQKEALIQEEECSMVERFYREIVEVSIFTAYSDHSSGVFVGGSLATSISAGGDDGSNYRNYAEEDDDDDEFEQGGDYNSKGKYQISSIVPSPTKLSFRKTINANAHTNTYEHGHLANANAQELLPKEISGFCIIYQTTINAKENNNDLGIGPNASGMSFATTDNDTSMHTTLLHNTTSETLDLATQTFDADLNPSTGLLSSLHSHDNIPQDLSFTNRSFESQPDHEKWSRLNFRRGIPQKLREQISPILATKAKAVVGECIGDDNSNMNLCKHYYIGYRRRGADENDKAAVADLLLMYCRVNKATIIDSEIQRNFPAGNKSPGADNANTGNQSDDNDETEMSGSPSLAPKTAAVLRRGLVSGASLAKRVAASGKSRLMRGRVMENVEEVDEEEESFNYDDEISEEIPDHENEDMFEIIHMHEILQLPEGFENGEWIIPCAYQSIKIPLPQRSHTESEFPSPYDGEGQQMPLTQLEKDRIMADRRMRKTYLFNHQSSPTWGEGVGVEAFVNGDTFLHSNPNMSENTPDTDRRNPWSPVCGPPGGLSQPECKSTFRSGSNFDTGGIDQYNDAPSREALLPSIISHEDLPSGSNECEDNEHYAYIPIVAVRRQRVGEEERFHEDSGIIDIAMTLSDKSGHPVIPEEEEYDEFDANDEDEDDLLGKSKWTASPVLEALIDARDGNEERNTNIFPSIIFQRNLPLGFVDTPFATSVLDRFPKNDYKGVPLPQEELPMFCYPTGCRLFRARYQDAPLAEYYGFVVKNERGDNIHVSCVSFMEPLESSKVEQLDQISEKKRRTSLAHKRYCERKENAACGGGHINDDKSSFLLGFDDDDDNNSKGGKHLKSEIILTGFDEMMTFELKTICLISRYPFWSAFRRFLSHLHILSGSSSELPLERYISHLLLAVPTPKPGGQCILLPLPAIASPMVLNLPPVKDMPLLDLPCHRLFSCLDAPTVVTIVLGFLVLERKVIIMSSYPSLVSDVCEILRSLLFPFELCAPYVPRLTSPFMSCLQFPGAIFVGIHDDGYEDGLAASVRREIPEDTFIVDLDTGDIDCNGDRYEILKECWDIIPSELRSLLVEEVETLCQDARLVPGQEPLGIEIEAALDVSITPTFGDDDDESLDGRAVRDCFLRFFCSILGGYERFLLVPDMDFLISGNEWFDTKGFLNATKTQSRSAFLSSFVSTQLFQSFIQRRTEASDVRCLLFDECLAEFHSSKIPYGRLSRYTETSGYPRGNRQPYDLLVDQCAAEVYDHLSEVDEMSSAEASMLTAHTTDGFMMVNNSGDFVTAPSRKNLPSGIRYVYCIDGHPHFPQKLDTEMFYPKEPECLSADLDEESVPILTRSDRENDASKIRRKLAGTHRGVQRQRRCLFQLPKVMGSHFLNSWLMCIPSQVSQQLRSSDQQQSYILRALGALRSLRSRQRIVPDEAGYRCLIVACGRADSDRRHELVKLFGLLRSDGIFPSAVTLGQYTRAIAEGFSKQSCGKANSSIIDQCTGDEDLVGAMDILDAAHPFDFLDGNLVELEESGKRWRSTRDAKIREKIDGDDVDSKDKVAEPSVEESSEKQHKSKKSRRKRRQNTSWSPVTCSSSFSPHWKPSRPPDESFDLLNDFRFIALWSRTTTCHSCSHTLLDEEIQAGWDEVNEESEISNEIRCPCCGTMILPKIGYNEMTIERVHLQSMHLSSNSSRPGHNQENSPHTFEENLPLQLQSMITTHEEEDGSGYVPYLNPARMRKLLEEIVEESGEEVLERETLRYLSPVVFFNLWWFCARFSLPLPLTVSPQSMIRDEVGSSIYSCHCSAFAAWDKSLALAGCRSGVKAVRSIQALIRKSCRPRAAPSFQNLVKSFDAPSSESGVNGETSVSQSILSEDFPLLSFLNLQSLAQGDWDNGDLSAVLVTLVEACEKRDFLPALKAVLQCNINRRTRYGRRQGVELECYITLLYLTRYQCTSAFHKFFPATCRVCKGYHFWCPATTITIFDRIFREASDRLRAQGNSSPILDVSDVALGFRSVFGHII